MYEEKKCKELNNTNKKYLHNFYGQMELISLVCGEDKHLIKRKEGF